MRCPLSCWERAETAMPSSLSSGEGVIYQSTICLRRPKSDSFFINFCTPGAGYARSRRF